MATLEVGAAARGKLDAIDHVRGVLGNVDATLAENIPRYVVVGM